MDTHHTFKRGLLSLAAISMALFTPVGVSAQEEVLEEIVVQGYRDSLKRSLNIKKDSIGVVDAISAEDLGKFPDRHLGEALQRVPGVTLQRDFASNGEGRRISVRGVLRHTGARSVAHLN